MHFFVTMKVLFISNSRTQEALNWFPTIYKKWRDWYPQSSHSQSCGGYWSQLSLHFFVRPECGQYRPSLSPTRAPSFQPKASCRCFSSSVHQQYNFSRIIRISSPQTSPLLLVADLIGECWDQVQHTEPYFRMQWWCLSPNFEKYV